MTTEFTNEIQTLKLKFSGKVSLTTVIGFLLFWRVKRIGILNKAFFIGCKH